MKFMDSLRLMKERTSIQGRISEFDGGKENARWVIRRYKNQRDADLYNPSTSVTMYVWFGADPASGSQIVLPPLASYETAVDTKADMRYKSSVAGGQLVYVLRG